MSALHEEQVLSVHHWTDRLFSFTTTRSPAFRYDSGQFTMVGIPVDGKPLLRAYSIVSPHYADQLEFLSIKVPNGPLTSRLQHLKVGDRVLIGKKATGTLLADNLLPGRNLYLLSTGTGLAPFMSIVKDPAVYERFDKIILCHGVRHIADLAYADEIMHALPNDEFIGELVREKLLYYPAVTREAFQHRGRLTLLMGEGRIAADLHLPTVDAAHDRIMICGSPEFLNNITTLLRSKSFEEGSSNSPGSYVIEKAFVER
jgi:ferredoxin--NADP+ reductase